MAQQQQQGSQVPPGQQQGQIPPGSFPIPVPLGPNGERPSNEQIEQYKQEIFRRAAAEGLTPQQYAQRLMAQHQAALQQAQRAQQQGGGGAAAGQQGTSAAPQQVQNAAQNQPRTVQGHEPPTKESLAVAAFLRSQDLKSRPAILQEQRRDMFKVKRAIRALQSPAYAKARSKPASNLPPVTDRASAENVFKLLPITRLALRVTRENPPVPADNPPHGETGHVHVAKKKDKAGKLVPWTVRIEQHQEANDDCYYVWFYEGSQWRQRIYAVAGLFAVVAVILFPLWPLVLRRGVWYLSIGAMGLLAAFFGLAIARLIIFVITVAVGPQPGIWLYPNLFADVGVMDSFRPVWAWRETKESRAAAKADKKARKAAKHHRVTSPSSAEIANGAASPAATKDAVKPAESTSHTGDATTTGADAKGGEDGTGQPAQRRNLKASVEEEEEEADE